MTPHFVLTLLLVMACTLTFAQGDPFENDPHQQVEGLPENVEWPPSPFDWDWVYMLQDPAYPRNFFTNNEPPLDMNELQYWMAYEHGRYNLSSILHMYKVTKDVTYLQEFVNQANETFSPTYFEDGDNGCSDGFLGWGMRRNGVPVYLGEPFTQNVWHHMKVRVQDTVVQGIVRTRIRTWFNNRFFDGWLSGPYGHDGTIALLSGWSKTAYKNVVVREINSGQVFYDLNSSYGTFSTDWNRMESFVPEEEEFTAHWELDVPTGEIRCDATVNTPGPFYYPWTQGAPRNPLPPNGSGGGKYAGLILMKTGALMLRNCEIDFDLKAEKRTHMMADVGVNIRYHCPDPYYLTHGRGSDMYDPDPSWRPYSRNTQFTGRSDADWLSVRVRPDYVGYKVSESTDSHFNKWSFGCGPIFLTDNFFTMAQGPRYSESIEYDAKICAPILRFVETVYEQQLSQFYSAADYFLTTVQNNIIAKWYVIRARDTDTWVYGGNNPPQYGGWQRSSLGFGMASPGHARLYSALARIVHKSYTHWAQATSENPSPYLPSLADLASHYQVTFAEMAQAWREGLWTEDDYYQWMWFRNFPGEFVPNGGPDLLHTAEAMEFAADAYEEGIYTTADMQKLARTFTDRVWNGLSGQSVQIYTTINGGAPPSFWNAYSNCDYFITLSQFDFKVWEIINDWWTRADSEGPPNIGCGICGRYYKNYRLIPAMLLYYTKYGTPRNFRVSSISGGGSSIELAWSNPSDYPTSLERPDGTGLRYFNVYKREYGQPWPSTPTAQLTTASHIFTDNVDPSKIIQYKIRSQDWTARFENESDDSNILTVYQGNNVNIAILELAMQNKSTSSSATWNNSGRHLAIKDGKLHEVFTSEGQIFYRRQNISSGTWEVTHWVSSSTNNGDPSLCVDHNNTVHVVWQRSLSTYNFELWYARSSDNGTTWSTPTILPGCGNVQVSSTQLSIYPVIAEWNNQRLVVVFCSTAGLMYTFSNSGGMIWRKFPIGIPSNYNPNYWVWYPSLASISNYLSLTYDYRYNGVWSRVYDGTSWSTETNVNFGTGMFFDRLSSVSNNGHGVPIAAWCAQLSPSSGYRIMYREGTSYNSWGWWTRFDAASNYSDFYPSVSAMYWGDRWHPAITHSNNYQWVLFKQYNPGWQSWDDCLMSTSGHWANVSAVGNTIEQPMATWTNQASNPYLIELYSGFCGEGEGNEMLVTSQYEQHRSVVIQHKGNRSSLSFEMLPMQVITTTGDTVAVPFKTHRAGEPVSTNLDSVWEYVGTEAFTLPDNASRLILETSITAMANSDSSGRVGTNSFTSRSFEVHLHRGNSRTPLWTNTTGTSGRFEADVRQFAGQSVIIRPSGIIPNGLRNQVDVGVGDVLVRKDSQRNAPLSKSASASLPTKYNLSQNYPNPFNPSTQINFDLPEPSQASLVVYDVLGRKVAELVNGYREAGYHSVTWNAGAHLASGVYLARFAVTNEEGGQLYAKSMKLMLMK